MPEQDNVISTIAAAIKVESADDIESIESVDLSTLNIPFLSGTLKGQKGIRASFRPGPLKITASREGEKDKYQRTFSVLLDASASRVLMVHSRIMGPTQDIHPEAPPEQAEADLRRIAEVYLSFPDDPPKISFMEALDAIRLRGVGYPLAAQEIDGIYVMDSRLQQPARAVWVITLRGLPPLTSKRNEPVWQRNYFRNIVDAQTGKWLYADNRPSPRADP
jgi:hypothetical protein